MKVGDSVAVNGCCLTAVKVKSRGRFKLIQFDLLQESWRRTNFQFARLGSLVNLELSFRANGELGGHFVTGHVDGLGKIIRWQRVGKDHVLDIAAPADVMRYVIFKGSIAVDGISLTVAAVKMKGFRIWIIPHTFEITALRERKHRRRGKSGGGSAGQICGKFPGTPAPGLKPGRGRARGHFPAHPSP